jgi:hypothetical protein
MALKANVANKVSTDKSGLVEGTIISVLEIEERVEIEKGKNQKYVAQFEFQIESPGTQKPILYRIWTRQNFNDEKFEREDGTSDYNTFTRLMLQLELIKESDLKDLTTLKDFDVEQCDGLKIQFELEKSKKSKVLKQPKLTSIRPVKKV